MFAAHFQCWDFFAYLSFCLSYSVSGGRNGERPALASFPRNSSRAVGAGGGRGACDPRRCPQLPAKALPQPRALPARGPARPGWTGRSGRQARFRGRCAGPVGAAAAGRPALPCPAPTHNRSVLHVCSLPASLKALQIKEEKHLPFVW